MGACTFLDQYYWHIGMHVVPLVSHYRRHHCCRQSISPCHHCKGTRLASDGQKLSPSFAYPSPTQTLTARGFDVEQYLLSPVQLGIPNTRLRYYCLASRRHADGHGKVAPIAESLPRNSSLQPDEPTVPLRPLSEFLVSTIDR